MWQGMSGTGRYGPRYWKRVSKPRSFGPSTMPAGRRRCSTPCANRFAVTAVRGALLAARVRNCRKIWGFFRPRCPVARLTVQMELRPGEGDEVMKLTRARAQLAVDEIGQEG